MLIGAPGARVKDTKKKKLYSSYYIENCVIILIHKKSTKFPFLVITSFFISLTNVRDTG